MSEEENIEKLEEEELAGAVDDSESNEDEEEKSPGRLLFNGLKDYDLVNGSWDNLTVSQKNCYEGAANDLGI